MSVVQEPEVKWSPEQMVEVVLNEPDDFLKVRGKKRRSSCHILHKQGRYFLVHFKASNLTKKRSRNIAQLLADWGLIGIVDVTKILHKTR